MAVQTTPRTSNKENARENNSSTTVDIWGPNGNTTTRYYNTRGKNLVGVSEGTPVNYNLAKVNVLDDITSSKWIEIKSTIVQEYKRVK